jgi:hypothetical protein
MNRKILNLHFKFHFALLFSSAFLIQCVQKERAPTSVNIVPEKISYEICHNDRKNYLEKQILEKVPRTYLENNEADWDKKIPMKCIQFAQRNFRGSYGICNSAQDKPIMTAIRPCLSENYTTLIYNAYHDVKNCFNLDPRSSFLQIMIESGFHLNAINKTGFDAGISQFTKNGILRVLDTNLLRKTREQLMIASSPSCQRISNVFDDLQKESAGINQRCSMMSVPQNPYRALVLHYLHTLKDQIFFKDQVLSKRPQISNVADQDILEQFVYMAYNRGITGTLRLIDGYIASRKKVNHEITKSDLNLIQNLSAARRILKNDPEKRKLLKKSNFKKLSFAEYAMIHDQTYLLNMAEAGDFVKSKMGDECF